MRHQLKGKLRAAHARALEQARRFIHYRVDPYWARYWLDKAKAFRKYEKQFEE